MNNQNNTHDDDVQREYYSEKRYNRTQRESRHRSPSESSDVSATHGVIDEDFKKKYLRCLAYMKLIERLYENQQDSDDDSETIHRRLSRRVNIRNTKKSKHIVLMFVGSNASRTTGIRRNRKDHP